MEPVREGMRRFGHECQEANDVAKAVGTAVVCVETAKGAYLRKEVDVVGRKSSDPNRTSIYQREERYSVASRHLPLASAHERFLLVVKLPANWTSGVEQISGTGMQTAVVGQGGRLRAPRVARMKFVQCYRAVDRS